MNEPTREAVQQWLARAKVDWQTVEILSSHGESPGESICFHCQQYVEKLLKALLTLRGVEAPRTHDLRRLIQLAAPHAPELAALAAAADSLTEHAVAMRYPDEWHDLEPEEVQEMVADARQFADVLLPNLR